MPATQLKSGEEYTDRYFLPKVLLDVTIDDDFVIEDAETMDLEEDEILNGKLKFVKNTEYESVGYTYREDTILHYLENRIFREIHMPRKWKDEGIAEPNITVNSKGKEIWSYFYNDIGILPFRIVPNKEDGITIIYKNYTNTRLLIIEVYNNLEMVGLVNDDKQKKILASQNINEFDFSELIRTYYEY